MIEFHDTTKIYNTGGTEFAALSGFSGEIENGEFVAILGPSGSGKSTLMHLIGGLDRPTAGRLLVDGQDLGALSDRALTRFRADKVGFVFQFFYLLPHLSALQNVMLPLIYRSYSGVSRETRARELLEQMGLQSKAKNKPSELSGGEQQRVAIARALAGGPEIILADEPTGNLDSRTGSQIMDLLTQLHAAGKTLIIVTHDREIAARAGRIIELRDGKLVDALPVPPPAPPLAPQNL